MRIYISGRITGVSNYEEKFAAAEREIKNGIDPNAIIFNPTKLKLEGEPSWSDYMKCDICLLVDCDTIFMMKGWRRSKGARLEHHIAKKLGFTIIYEA